MPVVAGEGFEPSKALPTDLQSDPRITADLRKPGSDGGRCRVLAVQPRRVYRACLPLDPMVSLNVPGLS